MIYFGGFYGFWKGEIRGGRCFGVVISMNSMGWMMGVSWHMVKIRFVEYTVFCISLHRAKRVILVHKSLDFNLQTLLSYPSSLYLQLKLSQTAT